MGSKKIIIKAELLFDGKTKKENQFIVIENDKIIDVTDKKLEAHYSGYVTPAFIDPHSHIGMIRQGEPEGENEVNDHIDQINPLDNPLNGIYFDDKAFSDAVDFGILYSCVLPGSGNLVGGKAMIIKNYAKNRNEALIKDYGFKMALGYNPRSTIDWKGSRPNTRMGVYSMLEKKFDQLLAKEKKAVLKKEKAISELNQQIKDKKISAELAAKQQDFLQQEYDLEFSSEDNALLSLLKGEKIAKVHVHKEDDVLYLIDLVKKYNLKVTAEHLCDVHHVEIFNELADNNIQAVYGPIDALDYKVELKNGSYKNVGHLVKSRLFYGLMTDHPVVISYTLRESLKHFLLQGVSEEEAINIISSKNAKILGIDDRLGTIEPGKLASVVVWNQHPLFIGAYPSVVLAEGNIIRNRE